MISLPSLCATLLLLASSVAARGRNLPYCADTCFEYPTGGNFNCVYDGEDYAAYIQCLFNDFAASGTYALCLHQYCSSDSQARRGYETVDSYAGAGTYKYTYDVVLPLAEANHTPAADYNATAIQTIPYEVSEELYQYWYPTIYNFYFQLTAGEIYGAATMFYWCGLMALAGLWRVVLVLFPNSVRRSSNFTKLVRKHITFPSLLGYKHTLPARILGFPLGFLPTRLESIYLAGFFILNLVLMMVEYHLDDNNLYWPNDKKIQLVRYFSDRSGVLAMVQIPVLILFAGRNNFLQWLTGWSFQSFMVYHRWIARAMFANAVIHSAGYTNYAIHYGFLAEDSAEPYWTVGICATVFGGLIMFQAMYALRHRWYEIFLAVHILFVIGFLVTLYYHLALEDLGYYEYIWASVAVWAFDRVVRVVRIALFGLATTAQARIVSANVFELRIKPTGLLRPKKAYPGQYSYIHLARFKAWESHPFSLVDFDEADGCYVYQCKAFNGMTRSVYKYLQAQPDQTTTLRVAVDGFYGEKFNVERHDTVVLVAGGIGITAIAQYAKYIKGRRQERQHVVLHWITRNNTDVEALSGLLNSVADVVDVHAYVTQGSPADLKLAEKSLDDEKIGSESSSTSSTHIDVKFGARPDMREVLTREVNEAEGSVAIAVCGPETLNDSCRNIVASLATAGRPGLAVQYFEESFSWA
ncbi:ferric reductase like transmembrane component-domain-containing protein [Dipodascopsis tothii]|uniref:ferric reductase like transmembrane component-domain-containing protein n=1 Tax=Dipodascopsis tothii TaxID=44089 RepID=UPI0034CF22FD